MTRAWPVLCGGLLALCALPVRAARAQEVTVDSTIPTCTELPLPLARGAALHLTGAIVVRPSGWRHEATRSLTLASLATPPTGGRSSHAAHETPVPMLQLRTPNGGLVGVAWFATAADELVSRVPVGARSACVAEEASTALRFAVYPAPAIGDGAVVHEAIVRPAGAGGGAAVMTAFGVTREELRVAIAMVLGVRATGLRR